MGRALLILIIFVAIAANAERIQLQNANQFTAADQRAMHEAEDKIFADEVQDGYRVEFKGDSNSGYFLVESQGHVQNREDLHCREVLASSGSASVNSIYCFHNRELEWVGTAPSLYVVDAPRAPAPIESASAAPAAATDR